MSLGEDRLLEKGFSQLRKSTESRFRSRHLWTAKNLHLYANPQNDLKHQERELDLDPGSSSPWGFPPALQIQSITLGTRSTE